MRRFKVFLTSLLVIVLVFGAYSLFSFYQQRASGDSHVVIYLIEATPTDFFLVPVERNIEGSPSPAVAMQALLNGPLADEEFFEAVPKGTKLLNLVIQGKLATANFSAEIKDDFPGGSLMEAYLVEAIVQTLTEFPEIETVQILVNGESIESIGGHILIKEPLRRKD